MSLAGLGWTLHRSAEVLVRIQPNCPGLGLKPQPSPGQGFMRNCLSSLLLLFYQKAGDGVMQGRHDLGPPRQCRQKQEGKGDAVLTTMRSPRFAKSVPPDVKGLRKVFPTTFHLVFPGEKTECTFSNSTSHNTGCATLGKFRVTMFWSLATEQSLGSAADPRTHMATHTDLLTEEAT